MKRAFKYLFQNKIEMFIGYFAKSLGTVVELFLPRIMAKILDDIVPLCTQTGVYTDLIIWGTVMLLCSIGACFLNVYANRRAAKASMYGIRALRFDLFKKMISLSGRKTDQFGIPSLVSRLTSDSYNIHAMFNISQRMGVRAILLLIGGLIMSATLDVSLMLTLLAVLPIAFFIVFTISRKGVPYYTKVQDSVDKMVRVMREDVTGIRVIKALSKEENEKSKFREANKNTVDNELKASGIMALSGPFISLALNLGLVLVVLVGAYRVEAQMTKPGTIIAFLNYFTMILNAIIAVNRILINYSKASASAKRIFEVMDAEDDLKVLPFNGDAAEDAPLIEFRNVWFTYGDDSAEDVAKDSDEMYELRNVSFTINKGESLGIIGSTGSGKTTILNLLMRYYDVSKGQILIDGRDIRTYDLKELRRRFGVAFQNNIIFADTVLENISFGRDIPEEDAIEATKSSLAYDFIMGKDGGFRHEAAIKGADFSGGQKQRLFMARALASHPEILVLDDSSSALDYATDAHIRGEIFSKYSSSTLICVAQRISSVMKLSRIIVIEDGEIIGYGTHDELIKNNEVYKEIASTQLGSLLNVQ